MAMGVKVRRAACSKEYRDKGKRKDRRVARGQIIVGKGEVGKEERKKGQ